MIGWRVGWVVGPPAIMADIALVGMTNVVCQVGIAQQAVAAACSARCGRRRRCCDGDLAAALRADSQAIAGLSVRAAARRVVGSATRRRWESRQGRPPNASSTEHRSPPRPWTDGARVALATCGWCSDETRWSGSAIWGSDSGRHSDDQNPISGGSPRRYDRSNALTTSGLSSGSMCVPGST